MIKIITGVRRCGKSYQVIAWAIPPTNIRVYGRYPHNETPAAFSVAGVPLIVVSNVVVSSSKLVVVSVLFLRRCKITAFSEKTCPIRAILSSYSRILFWHFGKSHCRRAFYKISIRLKNQPENSKNVQFYVKICRNSTILQHFLYISILQFIFCQLAIRQKQPVIEKVRLQRFFSFSLLFFWIYYFFCVILQHQFVSNCRKYKIISIIVGA